MKVVGLVSSYREGRLLQSALRSLSPLDGVLVFEGPVEGNPESGSPSEVGSQHGLKVFHGSWESDAAKRSAMVVKAKELWPGELWGLWLDGDEILLWGEYLRDWLERVRQTDEGEVAGWPFALVELDGSVCICMGKLVRVDLIKQYLASSSYIELVNGQRRTVGNVFYWNPVDGPLQYVGEGEARRPHWRARPPLQGEPHLLHRPILRDRGRKVERQHRAEERAFENVELPG